MFGFSATEILIFVAILVLLFGAKKIPDLARGIGEAVRHIRNGFSDEEKGKTENEKGKTE